MENMHNSDPSIVSRKQEEVVKSIKEFLGKKDSADSHRKVALAIEIIREYIRRYPYLKSIIVKMFE